MDVYECIREFSVEKDDGGMDLDEPINVSIGDIFEKDEDGYLTREIYRDNTYYTMITIDVNGDYSNFREIRL